MSSTSAPSSLSGRKQVLVIVTVDIMPWVLLRPWLQGLQAAGAEVHIACARGDYFARLAADGFVMHEVPLRRSFYPFAHLRPLLELIRLLRSRTFDAINTHSPVAGVIGRLAAILTASPTPVMCTVHGFYFHENMRWLPRRLFTAIEWAMGQFTSQFLFVSDEDRRTALQAGIVRPGVRAVTLLNGVDLERYLPPAATGADRLALRKRLGIEATAPVVGIVGRMVREKGYREFLAMASGIAARRPEVRFLVVGDSLPSDRDQFGLVFRRLVEQAGLSRKVVFTGFTDGVAGFLSLMDVFVLPSYREGFPRSVIEAMACGLPVVATNIRGCREAVVDGETGAIVPPRDARALERAVERLLSDPQRAAAMGRAGRARAESFYDYRDVRARFVDAVLSPVTDSRPAFVYSILKRCTDIVVSGSALLALSPLLALLAAAVRLSGGSSALFRQTRIGRGEASFTMYKFRTMTEECDSGRCLLPDEIRLTRAGRWIRAASLDELPQLWNVLRGEMSLVGPRPLLPGYLLHYSSRQARRHEVRPGITGLAQVNGRNRCAWACRLEYDVSYVEQRSFALDLKILALTVLCVLRRSGVSHAGHATMPEFRGEVQG